MTATATASTDQEPPAADTDTAPLARGLAWLYVVGGLAGLVGSLGLTLEKIAKIANPNHVPSCSLNPVISCGSVMDSPQGSLFSFPNPLIGLSAFAVVTTAGVVLLAGFHAPRWFWLGMQGGTLLGVVFVHWLIYESLYSIHALCPYCMIVWIAVIPMFWYTTLHNLERGHLTGTPTAHGLVRLHSVGLVVWFLVIVVAVLQAFWQYWTTLL